MDIGTTIDIFELAHANKERLESEYQLIKDNSSQDKTNLLECFGTRIKNDWTLSINMHDRALFDVLESGKYVNVYELKDYQAEQLINEEKLETTTAKSAKEEAVRKHLKGFHESRTIFDSCISKGEKTKYAALNIGGVGTTGYGRYCIVINRKKVEKYKRLAFIKGDSAVNYVDNGCFLLDKLSRDLANKECVELLAVLKHENDIEKVSSDKWHRMVCNDSCNIEAVTLDDILSSHIKCVRIDKKSYNDIYMDSLVKLFDSELTEIEQYRLILVKKVFKELKKRGIELEITDEN